MKIDSVDFFYLAMPQIRDIGDGSQDALLVRVRSDDGHEGWGECEASPVVTIAAWCAPMSHSACKPVRQTVLGRRIDGPQDIRALNAAVRRESLDLLQADHTLSGIDMALWDLLGRVRGAPVWRLLGWEQAYPKTAYASMLFGDTPEETHAKASAVREAGYRAAKFGWGPYGLDAKLDEAHVRAARDGLGPELTLLVDAGTVWGADVEAAALRLPALEACDVTWIEEPFVSGALGAYDELERRIRERGTSRLRTAAGEGSHEPFMAKNLVDFGGVGYIQIDAGRIGGLTSAYEVARYAEARGVHYVNHTFTTPLALSGSLQPFAGLKGSHICEYPIEPTELAATLTVEQLAVDGDGRLRVPDRPGLGMTPDPRTIAKYLRRVEIRVDDRVIYESPLPGPAAG
jgi:L-alanine-DL-glutamate epimerase-like enolase superfamily enzyme